MKKFSILSVSILSIIFMFSACTTGTDNFDSNFELNSFPVETGIDYLLMPQNTDELVYTTVVTSNEDSEKITQEIVAIPISSSTKSDTVFSVTNDGSSQIVGYAIPDSDTIWILFVEYTESDVEIYLCQFDQTGQELSNMHLGFVDTAYEQFSVISLSVASDSTLYLATTDALYAIDINGNLLFSLSVYMTAFILTENDIPVVSYQASQSSFEVRTVDPKRGEWDSTCKLNNSCYGLYNGAGYGVDFCYFDQDALYGYSFSTGKEMNILSWSDYDIAGDDIFTLQVLNNGDILCALYYDVSDIILLTATDADLDKFTITLATYEIDRTLYEDVLSYNRRNDDVSIEILDYMQYDDKGQEGLERLRQDAISGELDAEIIDLARLNVNELVTADALLGLSSFVDEDQEIELLPQYRTHITFDEEIYEVAPYFFIHTSIIDSDTDSKKLTYLEQSGDSFLSEVVDMFWDDCIDWSSKTVNNDMIQTLLRAIELLPHEADIPADRIEYLRSDEPAAIVQIMYDFVTEYFFEEVFQGPIEFIGYPEIDNVKAKIELSMDLGIVAGTANAEEAWSFVREYYTGEYQSQDVSYGFPTNQTAYNEKVRQEGEGELSISSIAWDDFEVEIQAATSDHITNMEALTSNSDGVIRDNYWLNGLIADILEDFMSHGVSIENTAQEIEKAIKEYLGW